MSRTRVQTLQIKARDATESNATRSIPFGTDTACLLRPVSYFMASQLCLAMIYIHGLIKAGSCTHNGEKGGDVSEVATKAPRDTISNAAMSHKFVKYITQSNS